MTKTSAISTMSPLALAQCRPILGDGDGVLEVIQAQNWALTHRPECHLSMTTGGDDWDDYGVDSEGTGGGSSRAVGTHDVTATAANVTVFRTSIWINPDAADLADLVVGAECDVAASNEVTVTFTFTGDSVVTGTCVCAPADNDTEVTDSFALSSLTAGGAWVEVEIAVQRTAGASANTLRAIRIEEDVIADGSLPDPLDD